MKNHICQQKEDKIKGYTLVEILVAVAIFSIAVAGPAALFVSAVRSQQKMLIQQRGIDNISYVVEYMSRALRMAKKDDIDLGSGGKDCLNADRVNYEVSSSGSRIDFRNHNNVCQRFYLDSNDGRLKEYKQDTDTTNNLTPEGLEIKTLLFKVSGESQYDNKQPRVTIMIGVAERGSNNVFMRTQTSVSQRDLDIAY